MALQLTSKDYVEYIKRAYDLIHANGDYITELDSATGDGDHWSNINMGFEKLVEEADRLETLNLFEEFKEIGKIMMSVIGGSSGVLYGSAYLGAAKTLKDKEVITSKDLCEILAAMLEAITARGNAQPGWKTMIDSLDPAVTCYKESIEKGLSEEETFALVKKAAADGAENTKNMEAVRGRATYQANKGLGHLDPGAVTMSYQISTLMDYALEKLQ
ncbi:dihydroxyacetone kinase subunit DhaL [Anaerocolumna sp.]|uniref:dihydroxyacetone kinase subunit DhaL n=1 Tax=Anaerocolumna sp. TaxID=2041569 RepID=UPI0028A70CA0|nr:dihydroxyacetone kinase subunit DhaL [Anaerocolumna sp.]